MFLRKSCGARITVRVNERTLNVALGPSLPPHFPIQSQNPGAELWREISRCGTLQIWQATSSFGLSNRAIRSDRLRNAGLSHEATTADASSRGILPIHRQGPRSCSASEEESWCFQVALKHCAPKHEHCANETNQTSTFGSAWPSDRL